MAVKYRQKTVKREKRKKCFQDKPPWPSNDPDSYPSEAKETRSDEDEEKESQRREGVYAYHKSQIEQNRH